MERLLANLKNRVGQPTLITLAAVLLLQLYTGCVTPGTTGQAQPDFIAQNSYQYQSQFQNSYQNQSQYPNSYGSQTSYLYRGGRPFQANYSNNPYGQGYNSQGNSPFDYGNQGLNGSYNQSPTGAYLDQSGTPITPLRDYFRNNVTQYYTQPSPTIYRPTGGFDQPNQSLDEWPSYTPMSQ